MTLEQKVLISTLPVILVVSALLLIQIYRSNEQSDRQLTPFNASNEPISKQLKYTMSLHNYTLTSL